MGFYLASSAGITVLFYRTILFSFSHPQIPHGQCNHCKRSCPRRRLGFIWFQCYYGFKAIFNKFWHSLKTTTLYLLSKRVLQLVNQHPRVPTKNPLSFWNSCSQQSRFHLVNLHQPENKILSLMVILTNCHNYINTPSHLSTSPLLHPTPTPTITNIIVF